MGFQVTQWLLNNVPIWALGAVCVGLTLGLTIVIARFLRPRIRIGEGHNDVTGLIFQTVGVTYALLTAFVVIAVWESLDRAEDVVNAEASDLLALYRDVGAFEPTFAVQVRGEIKQYAQMVVDHEWPELAEGRIHGPTRDQLNKVFVLLREYEPTTAAEQGFYGEALSRLNGISDARLLRLEASQGSLPGLFWLLVLVSTVLTLTIGTMLYMEHQRTHDLLVGALAVSAGLVLFLILVLDSPFSGDIATSPQPYIDTINLGMNRAP